MTRPPRLFFDASVLVASAGSTSGASSLTLDVCRHGAAKAVSSRLVLLEAERNIRAKLDAEALLRFYRTVAEIDFRVVPESTPDEIAVSARIIAAKDAHVLAAAVKAGVGFLLTLDRRHFLARAVLEAGLPFRIITPGDFLRLWIEDGS